MHQPTVLRRRERSLRWRTVQLSPQRLQEIGVTTGDSELQERKRQSQRSRQRGHGRSSSSSYVQTRFPGWIQDVFANATYQYVRKGAALFTIYSPDLVSSEQEYLLARQNQKTLCAGRARHGRA